MTLSRITSPHTQGSNRTQRVMLLVALGCVPGFAALSYFYGLGPLFNLVLAISFALALEAIVVKLRQRPVRFYLKDASALVTAILLALALPPYAPWWLVFIAVFFAMIFGKHLYGGLGQNPFNPAMLGYVVVLISFPVDMTTWLAPDTPITMGLQNVLGNSLPDGWSQATALDLIKTNQKLTLDELYAKNPASFGALGGLTSQWVNLGFLLGGLFLLYKRIISWHAPAAMLLSLSIMSLIFWNGTGSQSHGSPLFHLFTGATMLGAFFIVTDPVSGATSVKGRLIFGAGVGIITYVIRAWGGYPDGVAFAVLLLNLCAPTIDYFTKPRSYGHKKAARGFKTGDH